MIKKSLTHVFVSILTIALITSANATTTEQCATQLDGLITDTHAAAYTGSAAVQNEAALVRKLTNAQQQLDGERFKNTIRKAMSYRSLALDLLSNSELDLGDPPEPDLIGSVDEIIACVEAVGEPAAIARVEIIPAAVLFTGIDDSELLMAQAYDANDQPIPNVIFTWASNDAATVSVDSNGLAKAQVGLGSALITVTAEGIKSPPVTVLVALPVASAKLIDDAEVVIPPSFVDPNADLQVGLRLVTTLDGTTIPQVGEIIVGTGAQPIGGVVVASALQGDGSVIVTYELVPLDNIFTSLLIDETYDLSSVPFELGDDAAGLYDLEDLGNGIAQLTLKPVPSLSDDNEIGLFAAQATSKFMLDIFECEATASPPFTLTSNPGTLTLTQTASLTVRFAVPTSSITDLELARLDGEIRANFKAGFALTSQLTAEVKCEAPNMINQTILLAGPAFVLSPTISLGPNVALGGKVETQSLGIELTADATANAFVQYLCPSSSLADCAVSADFSAPTPKADYKIDVPDPAALAGLKIQPELSAGVTGSVSFGLPKKFKLLNNLLGKLTIEAVKGSLSLKQTGDFAFVDTQVLDDAYASNYKLAYEWEAGPGADVERLLNLLSFLLGSNDLKVTGGDDLAKSPAAITAKSDVDLFSVGETVQFMIDLNAATTDYPFFNYNVDRIKIYRQTPTSTIDLVADVAASANQTNFVIPWVADATGTVAGDGFFAFVTTNAFPVPGIGELELGKISSTPSCSLDNLYGRWDGRAETGTGWSGTHPYFGADGITFTDGDFTLFFYQTGTSLSGFVYQADLNSPDCAPGAITSGTFDGNVINFTTDFDDPLCGTVNFTGLVQELVCDGSVITRAKIGGTHDLGGFQGGTWSVLYSGDGS